MEVKYVQHMGDDLAVVNAARVSFAKFSEYQTDLLTSYPPQERKRLSDRDTKLIKYLATHNHWTPFGHSAITLHMKLPLFVQRQIDKHQVGFVVNEVSRRYVDDEPEFYAPAKWRARPDASIKQGSGEELDEFTVLMDTAEGHWDVPMDGDTEVKNYHRYGLYLYKAMLKAGIAPEMARMVLPQSMYTETWKTGSLYAWANLYNLRIDAHAQKETQEVARQVDAVIRPLFPVAWEALTTKEA